MGLLYLLPALAFYSLLFCKDALFLGAIIPFLLILVALSLKVRKLARFSLLAILVFSVSYKSLLAFQFSSSLLEEQTVAIYGYVHSQPNSLENRDSSFRLKAVASVDKNGSVFSSKGIIYVYSDLMDASRGDFVRVDGKISKSGYFSSKSLSVLKKAPFGRLRELLISNLREHFRFQGGDLSLLLLLGSDEHGDSGIIDLARKSGLSFLLSLSGMHLAIISSLVERPISMIFGKKCGKWLSFVFMFVFAYASGWKPSLFRAFLFKLLLNKFNIEEAFVLSYFLLLELLPGAISDLGSAFSFISLSGILMLSNEISSILSILPIPKPLEASLAASISATLFSTPATLEVFGYYQLLSIVWALPASFAIALYMALSLISLVLPQISFLITFIYNAIVDFLAYAATFEGQIDYGAYNIFALSFLSMISIKHLCTLFKKHIWMQKRFYAFK